MKPREEAKKTNEERSDLIHLDFSSPQLFAELSGPAERHFRQIAEVFGISLQTRGTHLTLKGKEASRAAECIHALYERLMKGENLLSEDIAGALRFSKAGRLHAPASFLRTPKRRIHPQTPRQQNYINALLEKDLVFALGAAGTGKTYLAAAAAIAHLQAGRVSRIVLTRPALEAGERLGFLPGDMREKIDPYLRPLYDALRDLMGEEEAERHRRTDALEVAPLAFMRGRSFSETFVVLDEAQNCTMQQMKMALTRLGPGGRMVAAGDPSQSDLPSGTRCGLTHAVSLLEDHPEIAIVRFSDQDVLRHGLVRDIVEAYARPRALNMGKRESGDG